MPGMWQIENCYVDKMGVITIKMSMLYGMASKWNALCA